MVDAFKVVNGSAPYLLPSFSQTAQCTPQLEHSSTLPRLYSPKITPLMHLLYVCMS